MDLLSFLKRHLYTAKVPARLAANFIHIDKSRFDRFEERLRGTFYGNEAPGFLETTTGQRDLSIHLLERLSEARSLTIPWLDSARPLQGSRVLEIGCGTGSSTAAMAEQGATVIGVDVDEASLKAAEARMEILGLGASFVRANATEVADLFSGEDFDFVIFYASLEHMTHQERLGSLESIWKMLRKDSLLVVTETPNRLWFHDFHTSYLPFFMWLPDDLAFRYSRFSPRDRFREVYRDFGPDEMLHFLRRGRGVSYHEFDLAIGPAEKLTVISSLASFHRRRLLPRLNWRLSRQYQFSRFLAACAPAIHHGFFEPRLDLIIRKS